VICRAYGEDVSIGCENDVEECTVVGTSNFLIHVFVRSIIALVGCQAGDQFWAPLSVSCWRSLPSVFMV